MNSKKSVIFQRLSIMLQPRRAHPGSRSRVRLTAIVMVVAAVSGLGAFATRAGVEGSRDKVMAPVFAPLRAGDSAVYLEFRARNDDEFGHAYMVLEIADAKGRVRPAGIFGFGTATGAPSGLFSLFGSPGEIGYTGPDLTVPPVETYRVRIDRAAYVRIAGSVGEMRKTWTVYELLFFNCNTLVGEVAHQAGLSAPAFDALFPSAYVQRLRELNAAAGVRGG
jgi:hypothetical protein